MLQDMRIAKHSIPSSILLILFCVFAFGFVATAVTLGHGPGAWDAGVAQWVTANQDDDVLAIMIAISQLHNALGVSALTLALCCWFHWQRMTRWSGVVLFAVPSGMLLNLALKHLFQRGRPSTALLDGFASTFSFPSGHTMAATLVWGVAAWYLATLSRSLHLRAVAILCGGAISMAVGLSRVYLGVHYMSDVVAAILEGVAWLALTVFVLRPVGAGSMRRLSI